MKEVPVSHDFVVPKSVLPRGMRRLSDKRWVLDQFPVGVPEIAFVVGYKNRTIEVWRQISCVMRDTVVHPELGVVDESMVLLPVEPVRLWMKRS